MISEHLKLHIFKAVADSATLCWSFRPSGPFETETAKAIGGKLIEHVERELELLARTEHTEAAILRRIERLLEKLVNKNTTRVVFGWKVDAPRLKERNKMPIQVKITNEQKVTVHLAPVSEAGKPAKLDGVPTWAVVSGPAKVVPAADGLSADIISDDNDLSDTIIKVDGDADLGSGVEDVADTITVSTTHANAANLGLTADAPVIK